MSGRIELSSLRNITVKRVGTRIHMIGLGPEPMILHMKEAERVFEGLLKSIPGIFNAIHLAWEWRNTPTIKVRMFYGLSPSLEIVHTSAVAEAYVHNSVVARSKAFPTKEEAYAFLTMEFGTILELTEIYDCPGSYKKAEKEKVMMLAKQYAEAQGITLDELWKRIKQSQTPKENVP